MLRTTPRRRQSTPRDSSFRHNLYPHMIISNSEQFLERFTTTQLFITIVLGFLVIFGFLAFYLPKDPPPKRQFIETPDDSQTLISSLSDKSKRIHVDPEGRVHIFYYPWVCTIK